MLRACLLAVAVVLALATPASALIQLDRGIAGARLGNSKAQVRAALGTPSKVTTGINDFGPFTQFRYAGGIAVLFQGNRDVNLVRTTGLGDRTSKGIGVGSSERALTRRHPGVSCANFGSARICATGPGNPGDRVTNFFMRGGRVARIDVARVVD
jgi:hypothetical protein